MNRIGRCICGQVKYSVSGPVLQVVACHCTLCRRMSGSAFSSYVVVKEQDFSVDHGKEGLTSYEVTDRTTRHFCAKCGTPVFNLNPTMYAGLAMLYLGTLEGHEDNAPRINIFCESKLPSVTTNEQSKSFPQTPRRDA